MKFKFQYVVVIAMLWAIVAFMPADRASDKKLLQQISDDEMKDYRSWPLIPGSEALSKGTGPHGDFITTYVNPVALKAIESKAEAMPEGALIIKDNFTEEKEYRSTVIMKKIDGKWFWGTLKPFGVARSAGNGIDSRRGKTCLNCHTKDGLKDGVYYWK